MAKLLFALSVLGVCVWIYTLIDCIRTDESRARGLPKAMWVILLILLPLVGSALWFTIGKGRTFSAPTRHPMTRQKAPDDDVAFLGRIGMEQDREERIRKLEERLAELDDDSKNQKD